MKIAYFSNHFAAKNGTGVARYAHELFNALRAQKPEIDLVPVATWSNQDAEPLEHLTDRTGLRLLPWGRKLTPLAWTFLNAPPIEKWLPDIDVVHSVFMGFPVATRKPLVVTIHDIGPLTHPELFSASPRWIMKRSLKQTVRQAAAIICVSQSTADEFATYVAHNLKQNVRDRIHVIGEGVDERFFAPPDKSCLQTLRNLPVGDVPFILTAGKMSPRKNVQGVIRALAMIRDKIPHHLVVVGGDGWDTDVVTQVMEETGLRGRVHFLGFVTDCQLHALYATASAYVHPSLFEGFGLTILEAMAACCPVVTSNVFSLPEVAGAAALLVDPHDLNAIAEAILSICTDESLASRLRDRGIERARTFTWEKAARQVADLYASVAKA